MCIEFYTSILNKANYISIDIAQFVKKKCKMPSVHQTYLDIAKDMVRELVSEIDSP